MSKSIEQQAADICRGKFSDADIAAALSRSGLLVSERDVLCQKLADACLAEYGFRAGHGPVVCDAYNAILAYDRVHTPKPRYYVEAYAGGFQTHRVIDRLGGAANIRGFGTEAECTAVAAALNALAEKEAGR